MARTTLRTGRNLARYNLMNEAIHFVSRCPHCGNERVQDGYSRRVLMRLINTCCRIEAYCVVCDEFWGISETERVTVAAGVGG
jgi:hypothetical protein